MFLRGKYVETAGAIVDKDFLVHWAADSEGDLFESGNYFPQIMLLLGLGLCGPACGPEAMYSHRTAQKFAASSHEAAQHPLSRLPLNLVKSRGSYPFMLYQSTVRNAESNSDSITMWSQSLHELFCFPAEVENRRGGMH